MTNVLLVSLDTLRADVAYSGKFPNFQRLKEEGTCLRNVVASAPFTPVSHASVFTALHPPGHGVRHLLREQMRTDVPTLGSRLKAAGYATAAVVACPGLNRWYGMDRGFDHYDDEIPLLPDGRDPLQVADVKIRGTALKRAPLVVERALEWLSKRPAEPFLLFAHFFDSHWPYEPPEDYGLELANPYEGEVAYMDHYLGELLNGIENMGHALDDMLIACFSDHGEDLAGWYPNDHAGDLGHPEEEGHGCLLFDATQMVPLWLRFPGRVSSGAEIQQQVRLVDLTPTLLDILDVAPIVGDGESLTPLLRGEGGGHRMAYSETFFPEERAAADPAFAHLRPLKSLRLDNGTKMIWQAGGDLLEIYDLAADPNERHPQRLAGLPSPAMAAPQDLVSPASVK